MKKAMFLLKATVFLLLVANCNGASDCGTGATGASSRSSGNDEFKCINSVVRKGPDSGATLPEFNGTGWHTLNSGEAISTDADGEAELNLAACWDGRIFVYEHSSAGFQVSECRKRPSASVTCAGSGTILVGACAAAMSIDTGSARVTFTGTSFSVTYLPEDRDITLVVALEGGVEVEPVEDLRRNLIGPPIPLPAETFLFTMPNAALGDLNGVPPRSARPMDELPDVVDALGLQVANWIEDVRSQATADGYLPASWPAELGGTAGQEQQPSPTPTPLAPAGVVIRFGGGPLEDETVQRATLMSVEWNEVAGSVLGQGQTVVATVADGPVDVLSSLPFDPDEAAALLDETGFAREGGDVEFQIRFSILLVYPGEDEAIGEAAQIAAEFLASNGIASELHPVPRDELEDSFAALVEQGETVLVIQRPILLRGFDRG